MFVRVVRIMESFTKADVSPNVRLPSTLIPLVTVWNVLRKIAVSALIPNVYNVQSLISCMRQNVCKLVLMDTMATKIKTNVFHVQSSATLVQVLLLKNARAVTLLSITSSKHLLLVYVRHVIFLLLINLVKVIFILSLECHSRCLLCYGPTEAQCLECLP